MLIRGVRDSGLRLLRFRSHQVPKVEVSLADAYMFCLSLPWLRPVKASLEDKTKGRTENHRSLQLGFFELQHLLEGWSVLPLHIGLVLQSDRPEIDLVCCFVRIP